MISKTDVTQRYQSTITLVILMHCCKKKKKRASCKIHEEILVNKASCTMWQIYIMNCLQRKLKCSLNARLKSVTRHSHDHETNI